MSDGGFVSSKLLAPRNREHMALLYDSLEERNSHIAAYFNDGLKKGELCVLGTVHFRDTDYLKELGSLIEDFRINQEKGNLIIVDLAPHYIAAMLDNLDPFEESIRVIRELVATRDNKNVRLVGDCAGFLFKNKHFNECTMLEQWWHLSKGLEGSVLCVYQRDVFNSYPYDTYSKRAVVSNHDIVLSEDNKPSDDQQKALANSLEDFSSNTKIGKGGNGE